LPEDRFELMVGALKPEVTSENKGEVRHEIVHAFANFEE